MKGGMIRIKTLEEFESKYGDLQFEYNEWRRCMEKQIQEKKEKGGFKGLYFTDCSFAEARESFSEYCNLKETIPFDLMLRYQNCFPDE